LQPDSGLRLVNPHPIAVDATLSCAGSSRDLRLDAHAVADLAVEPLCTSPTLESTLRLLTLETRGEATQRGTSNDEGCAPVTMSAPLFACARGVATASVPPVEGATYSWTAANATITGATNTSRVTVNLGDTETAKLRGHVRAGRSAPMELIVTASYPDGFCARSDKRTITVVPSEGSVTELKVEPATIKAGGTATITYKVNGSIEWMQTVIRSRLAAARCDRSVELHDRRPLHRDLQGHQRSGQREHRRLLRRRVHRGRRSVHAARDHAVTGVCFRHPDLQCRAAVHPPQHRRAWR
jgi:hypothetical protein